MVRTVTVGVSDLFRSQKVKIKVRKSLFAIFIRSLWFGRGINSLEPELDHLISFNFLNNLLLELKS